MAGYASAEAEDEKEVIILETQLLRLRPTREHAFINEFLAFASTKYASATTMGWTAIVHHVTDPTRWVELYHVARYSGQEASTWAETDAWSTAWDEPDVLAGFVHARSRKRRKQLARKIELLHFDPALARKAVNHDLLVFINDVYATIIAESLAAHPLMNMETFSAYILAHEAMHYIEDWTRKKLVCDGVPPWLDMEVISTLNDFAESIGGWDAFKQRYLI